MSVGGTDRRRLLVTSIVLVLASFAVYQLTAIAWQTVHPGNSTVVQLLTQWDSGWYLRIVEHGYTGTPEPSGPLAGQANWAFFPLYPLSVALVARTTGVAARHAGIVLSNIYLVGAIYFAIRYMAHTRDHDTPHVIGYLLAFAPYTFYFSTMYAESLYVFLLAAGFYFVSRQRWIRAGIAGGLASATRPLGVLFVLVLLTTYLQEYADRELTLREMAVGLLRDEDRILAVGLVPLGIGLYMWFLYVHIGDPLAFVHVQTAWNRHFTGPIAVLVGGLVSGDIGSQYLAAWGTVGLLGGGVQLYRKYYHEGVFLIASLIVPAGTSLKGLPRFVIGSLVFLFVVADVCDSFGAQRWIAVVFLACANVPLVLLWFAGQRILV